MAEDENILKKREQSMERRLRSYRQEFESRFQSLDEREIIEQLIAPILKEQEFQDIQQDIEIVTGNEVSVRPDLLAQKQGQTYVFEVKYYRNLHNTQQIIDNALQQMMRCKLRMTIGNEKEAFRFIMILLCKIDTELKKEIYQQYHMIVWDICNLIYLCEDSKELYDVLQSIMPYSIVDLRAEQTIDAQIADGIFEEKGGKPTKTSEKRRIADIAEHSSPDNEDVSLVQQYRKKLEQCKTGKAKKAAQVYEQICTDIIRYLFETEFFRMSAQHQTDDQMFRMDLLCSLKGTTEFWKFLMTFYHTKFVVFEYKNYKEQISQNLIYITEKYLFPVALRNVAFIISRKGFDQNAQAAALGCLRESGKLVVDLKDEDLLQMVDMKENGEEPSDYLLEKVEALLMSVSK